MSRGMQNAPEGVRLAARYRVDFVELDVVKKSPTDGFCCVHGWGRGSDLESCLAEMGEEMGLMAHLKGSYEREDLERLLKVILPQVPLERVIFASHGDAVLRRLHEISPNAQLARFGLMSAISAMWEPKLKPWQYCLIHHSVLLNCHVKALQRRGYSVMASCVWEFRSRDSVKRLGVDGAFVNLYADS